MSKLRQKSFEQLLVYAAVTPGQLVFSRQRQHSSDVRLEPKMEQVCSHT